jgi:hypothetical protein
VEPFLRETASESCDFVNMKRREFLLHGGLALGGLLTLPKVVMTTASALDAAPQSEEATAAERKALLASIAIDAGELTKSQQADMDQVREWLAAALQRAGILGAPLVLTTAKAHPELATQAKLQNGNSDACAVFSEGGKTYLLGATVTAMGYAAAQLLRELGFASYAPSPRWQIVPTLQNLPAGLHANSAPSVASRSIWYAYGMPDKGRAANYAKWVFANRLTANPLINVGHSYGSIIGRNKAEFEAHPEYYALREDGKRDQERAIAARKFCTSNAGLIELVAQDRIRLLDEARAKNPAEYMVSVEPSDGEGVCQCENCKKLGAPSDRVFYLANAVARKLRAVHPGAWVGLYAYADHRLPPNIEVEPNVYVQVALAFNRTQYTLPELVELWSKKVSAIGLREYYGVEAWDWGLPGRMRGGNVEYHRQWIPYYAQRKLTSINAETNANWGAQMLGLYIASELMWDTKADVDALTAKYFTDCFGPAAVPMKALQAKFDAAAPLNPPSLSAMFEDAARAYELAKQPEERARINDMMAYLLYVDAYRRFDLVADSQPSRNDVYYEALRELMTYVWRIRDRDMVHYYALARRLCNGLPLKDKRPEFWYARKEEPAVWMTGEPLTDAEIDSRFRDTARTLQADKSVYATYSRYFEDVHPPGEDAGASHMQGADERGISNVRSPLTGYLVCGGELGVAIGLRALRKPVTLKVFVRGEEILTEQTVKDTESFQTITVVLPKAGEYRFEIIGDAMLKVADEVPMALEASVARPAWIDSSGPYYFYVPKGAKQLYLDGEPRLTFFIPGVKGRQEIKPSDRVPGQTYSIIDVPEGAAGQVWHTDSLTRGKISFLNIPPFLSINRKHILIPREVSEADGLTTAR